MQKKLLIILTVSLLAQAIGAQPYCSVKNFNLRDGLASSVITSFQQTSDQLLWFSTWNGLTCYDGYRFTTFRDIPHSGSERQRVLTTNRLQNIETNSVGNIWCITYDLNAFLFDRRSGQYVDITSRINQKFGITFHTSRAITTASGHTWLLNNETGGPVVRIDDRDPLSADGMELFKPSDALLQSNEIFWVYETSEGKECLITDKGLVYIDGSYRSDRPFRFVQEVGSYMFLGTTDGQLCLLDAKTKRQMDLRLPAEVTRIGALVGNGASLMVVATNAGLYVYDVQQHQGRLIHLPIETDILAMTRTLYIDSRNRLWMGTEEGDVLCVNLVDDSVERSIPHLSPLKQSSHTFFHEDRYHTLWVATNQGFFGYYDEQHHQLVSCQLRTSFTQPIIERWFFDAQGNLWYSGEHNLAMVSFSRRNITHVTQLQEVRSIMFDHQNRIWAGTLAGDIAIYNPNGQLLGYLAPDGHITQHSTLDTQQHPTFSTHIYCLYQDRQQRIWIGTKGDGLYCLNPDGRLRHYTLGDLPSNQVYDVHQDYQGRIWVGTFQQGICLLEEVRGENGEVRGERFLCAPDQLKGYPISDFHKVRRITETHDSTIIVSASNGLVTFSERFTDPAKIRFYAHKHVQGDSTSLLTSDVMQAFVTDNDSVFIATVGGGVQLVRADELLSEKLRLRSVNRLMNGQGTVMTILQDKQGNLWTGCENVISMFEHTSHQLWCFGPSHIGEHTEFTEAEPAFNPLTGQIALATTDGFICFQPEHLQEDQFVPSLVFTGVQLHGEQGVRRILHGDSLEVDADQRNLTIYFAALDYRDNYMINYAYKLEGIDNEWNELGSEHSITFNNLPAGRHRLLVRSTNSYGTWVDNVHTLYIYAHPTFWESWWAKLLYALLLLLVIGVAIWIYRLRTRNSIERKLNDMKTQFFTDVSHKLRTPLTLIGGPVTQVLQAGGLTDTARNHLEMVERNAHRMLELVNKMLTYSKEHHTYISDESIVESGETAALAVNANQQDNSFSSINSPLSSNDTTKLLIVEDNDDLRQFLVSILQSDYEVMQASNGREGLEKAQTEQPDFILTDVMMPEMDGLEMVHRIKADQNISHIPIVILSAKASMDDRIEGLKAGVNDYITKPFSATYLKQRMANIIQNQRLLQQSYLASINGVRSEEIGVRSCHAEEETPNSSLLTHHSEEEGQTLRLRAANIVDTDKQLMEQLLNYIEDNISNPDLKIEDLATALCLGRTVFYNKVKTLVGMSPVELLRHIRIQHAEEFVAKSNEPFSQIAYSVGFSDPRYFGKCFKKQTGLTPSEYREQRV